MSLRLWRKIKPFSYSKIRFSFRKTTNPWHTISLSSKQQRFFNKKGKQYSPELRSFFPSLSLYFKNSFSPFVPLLGEKDPVFNSFSRKEHKGLEWRSLSSSSFWVFKNPMAVPGAVKIRRSKSVYKAQLSSSLSSFVWYSRLSFRKASNLYAGILRSMGRSNTIKGALETLWPILLMKIGFFPTVGEAKTWMKYHNVSINGQPTTPQKVWFTATPADFFSKRFFPLYNPTNFKTFIQKMCGRMSLNLFLFISFL